jgi:transcription-repair coupling factor (superfamily II helicase)
METKESVSPLLRYISALPAYQNLFSLIHEGKAGQGSLSGLGLPRATRLPVLANLHTDLNLPFLLLTNRADRALALFDELAFWAPDARRLYFPEPSSLFYDQTGWSLTTHRERLQVLTDLASYHLPGVSKPSSPPIIVAPIRSVMTRTLPRRDFLRNIKILKPGKTISPEEIIRHWVGIGYEHSNIVVQMGQFSRRGGILDIWSPGSLLPVRIEFFGDEIDTLRSFNPATQRTVEALDQTVIYPVRELLPVDAEKNGFVLERLSESHLPQVYPFPSSLMDFLPDSTLILLDGEEFIAAAVNDIEEDAIIRRKDAIAAGTLDQDAPIPYITWTEIEDGFHKKQVIELGHSNTSDIRPLAEAFDPGPRFNGRLKDLLTHLNSLENQKHPWTIVSRQSSRLRDLWRETHLGLDDGELDARFLEGSLSSGWVLHLPDNNQHHLLTDSEIFGWGRPQPRRRFQPTAEAPESIYGDLMPGDWVVHIDHGIGKFMGLIKPKEGNIEREYLCIEYKDNDQLFVPIHQADRITRYVGSSADTPNVSRLGGSEWTQTKQRVRHAVQEVAIDLLELYAKRKMTSGYQFSPDTPWQKELEASFPYIETDDQLKAINEVKRDMESPRPMDRLLCGDVGYGKTEVILRAAFKAVMDGKQVAVLVPTTVLAQQHFDTFSQRLSVFPVQVEMLSRFRKPKEQSLIIKKLANQQIDIIIGTHRLISQDVQFKDLGLVIIDEEQRFGVTHKEHLKKLRTSVDVLTLTATPIPRTLYMALTGARDISNINTPPEERLPIVTHIGPYDQRLVREAIVREMERGGQVFFVHNRVKTITSIYNHLSNLIPEARIGIGHGQMPEEELADVMHAFNDGQIDVLLCTSIIESGLDIPNANTLIIDRADTFGLAQLYQLRGRVGRGAQRAYAYLFRHKYRPPTMDGQERMEILAENTQLGSGYAIAMRDLEMRGAGDLLGTRQSGYIASVGFHLYTKLLSQAIQQFRKTLGEPAQTGELPVSDVPSLPINVELPLTTGLPIEYIPDQALRLNLYRRIANLRNEEDITATAIEFEDRFGTLPQQVENLLWQMKVKIRALHAGLASISLENDQLTLQYPPLPQGIKQRDLVPVDFIAKVGKNAYRIPLSPIKDISWQDYLMDLLLKLEGSGYT